LYLAQKKIKNETHYFIRESYRHKDIFLSRDLFYLGTDPARYIVYPGGNSFYIDTIIEDQLDDQGITPDSEELEDIFWRFLNPEIQRTLEHFRRREQRSRTNQRQKRPQEILNSQIHLFDKRRVSFLKFGKIDQRDIGRLPPKLFRMLRRKSRDEIEQSFIDQERILIPREYKAYTYSIFNLQQFFYESFAKSNPQMLNQEHVDSHFIEQVCGLNSDDSFWGGMKTNDKLHEYLVRYVLMYFDYDYAPRSFIEDYIRNFVNSRRDYRPPNKSTSVILTEAGTLFGETKEALEEMSRKDIARLYRRKAQKLHPDKGGDHDTFVKLTAAYHELLKLKT